MPDPGTPEKRRELCERIGGKIEKVIEKKKGPGNRGEEKIVKKTIGGILHWGRETENNALVHANDSVASKCLQDFAGVPFVSFALDHLQHDRLVTAAAKDKE